MNQSPAVATLTVAALDVGTAAVKLVILDDVPGGAPVVRLARGAAPRVRRLGASAPGRSSFVRPRLTRPVNRAHVTRRVGRFISTPARAYALRVRER